MVPNDFVQWLGDARNQTEAILDKLLPVPGQTPSGLHEAMRYAALDGGKRLRPLLVLAAARLGMPETAALEAAMAAVECIHVYSLVHDDMPAMDNDSLRRGKPTCHVRYGEAAALLTGDALQTLAFALLSELTALPPARQLHMVRILAKAAGSFGMAGGQAIDLANTGRTMSRSDLEEMHGMKTGALIRAAAALGVLACPDLDETVLDVVDSYAVRLGLAFQVMDDVLDCEADTATLGKTAGKDAQNNKPTYVRLMGAEAAKDYARQLVCDAKSVLLPFGTKADYLCALADFVTARRH